MSDSDALPEGWTVEVKVRKNGRKDKYYIDPLKGYIFQSRRDVLRYCENGEVGKYVKSMGKDIADGEMEDDNVSTPIAKEQSLVDSSPKTEVSQKQDWILNEAIENGKTCKSNPQKISGDAELIKDQCKQGSVTSFPSPSEGVQKGESTIQKSTDDMQEKNVNDDSKPGLVGKSKRKLTELPRRSSKRLAGLQIDQPPEIKTKTRAGPVLAIHLAEAEGSLGGNTGDIKTVAEKADSEDSSNQKRSKVPKKDPNSPCLESQLPEMISHIKEISASEGCAGNIETEDTTKKLEQNHEKQTDFPRQASKRFAGLDIAPQMEQKVTTRAHRVSSEPLIENKLPAPINLPIPGNDKIVEESKLPSEPLLNDIWMDPCFDFAVKTLTDVIPVEDHLKTQQPSSSSSECLWEDPCIQFAVKTLTGDIPLVVDFGVEEYIRKQMAKNQTAVHSDSSSFLGSMEKDVSKKPVMNRSRNGSMPTPVNNKIN